jgi:hypothetical protein
MTSCSSILTDTLSMLPETKFDAEDRDPNVYLIHFDSRIDILIQLAKHLHAMWYILHSLTADDEQGLASRLDIQTSSFRTITSAHDPRVTNPPCSIHALEICTGPPPSPPPLLSPQSSQVYSSSRPATLIHTKAVELLRSTSPTLIR